MQRAPTVRSLAKIAGVSASTISLALRNHPRISPAERARIRRIAEEMGYRPNPLMSRLTSQLRMSRMPSYQSTLGIVFTAARKEDVEQLGVMEWIEACESRVAQMGYGADRFVFYESGLTPARLSAILDARNIEGLVAIGPFRGGVIPAKFDILWERRATVVIGAPPFRPPLSYVSNDQFSTALLAVREALRLGYRRPGLCIHPHIDEVVEGRFEGGFFVGQRVLPPEQRLPVCSYDPKREKQFHAWIAEARPDVILTLHPEIAMWLGRTGLHSPRDIGLIHLDKTPDLDKWAGMRQNHQQIGLSAVDMVLGQLQRNELGIPPFQKCTIIRSEWAPGTTVRKQG
jgi:LacI family transcriptional regulator